VTSAQRRRELDDLLGAEDLAAAVKAYLDGRLDQDRLKVAFYALLVHPIGAGVFRFVRKPTFGVVFEHERDLTRALLAERIGLVLFHYIWDALEECGYIELAEQVIESLAEKSSPDVARMRRDLPHAIKAGAMSSARATMRALEANAYTVQRESPEISREEEIILVTRSSSLAIANQVVHLEDMGIVRLILSAYNYSKSQGEGYPEELLRFNEQARKVMLSKTLPKWSVGPNLTVGELAERHPDVRLGCPFAHSREDLRKGYYEAIVDLVATYGQWPGRTP
jgi:hypothetical protein